MRDGRYIDTVRHAEASIQQIISMMVGRTIYEAAPELPGDARPEVVLEVRNLNRGRARSATSASSCTAARSSASRAWSGAGRTEVMRAVFGADPPDSGEILIHGKPSTSARRATPSATGSAYLSEDRKRYGLALGMDVEANVVLARCRKFTGARLGPVRPAPRGRRP